MYFTNTLNDWSRFDINNRTRFDATISSGLAIMACNKNLYRPKAEKTMTTVSFGLSKYNNKGVTSKKIE